MSDENGLTVHEGESLSRINAILEGFHDRGIQADAGHCGIDYRGGKIWNCWNDGAGGETGDWLFSGTKFENNGIKNKDSGDGCQITNPFRYEIHACEFLEHPNAGLIFCQLEVPGIIRHNRFIKARHGLAIEFKGVWENSKLADLIENIEKNFFKDCGSGIYIYGKEQDDDAIEDFCYCMRAQNTFEDCDDDILIEWGNPN